MSVSATEYPIGLLEKRQLTLYVEHGRYEEPCFWAWFEDEEGDIIVAEFWTDYDGDADSVLAAVKFHCADFAYLLLRPRHMKAIVDLHNKATKRMRSWLKTKAGRKFLATLNETET